MMMMTVNFFSEENLIFKKMYNEGKLEENVIKAERLLKLNDIFYLKRVLSQQRIVRPQLLLYFCRGDDNICWKIGWSVLVSFSGIIIKSDILTCSRLCRPFKQN